MTAVVVMAKAPRPGTVKTRLHPLLGPAGSADLQRELLRHTCTVAAGVGVPTVLCVDPPDAAAELAALAPAGVTLLPQAGGDLGRRLTAAADAVAVAHPGPVVVIGVDAPTLTAALLAEAFAALDRGVDAVLGPALDGGYYLIGLRRPTPAAFAIHPALWSGDRVLAATLDLLRQAGLRIALLPALRDLDTPADAAALLADPALPPAVAARLRPVEVPA